MARRIVLGTLSEVSSTCHTNCAYSIYIMVLLIMYSMCCIAEIMMEN